jgi:Protein of unknown function (DUF4058)
LPLLDHFHEPLDPRADWQSFHNRWANAIADLLDQVLPRRYFARVQANLGRHVEADVAEFESLQESEANGSSGSVAVQTYAPPKAGVVLPAVFPDDLEVQVCDTERGARLAAVIELVSPANKDRPEHRQAFSVKCAAYLQRGIGLIIVDTVSNRHFNLHNELLLLLGGDGSGGMPDDVLLYAAAYRPVHRDERNEIDVWDATLAVDQPLPTLPLALRGNGSVPLDLEASYTEARRRSRLA